LIPRQKIYKTKKKDENKKNKKKKKSRQRKSYTREGIYSRRHFGIFNKREDLEYCYLNQKRKERKGRKKRGGGSGKAEEGRAAS
jgi:hypothetical protein